MRLSNLCATVLRASIVAGMLMSAPALVSAGDACKDVKFQFKNQRSARIKVYKVEYFNAANGKTQTEQLNPEEECPSNTTCTTSGDNLRDSEGGDLRHFVFYFNDQEADGDWSKDNIKTQWKEPVTQKYSAGMTYKGGSVWTIN